MESVPKVPVETFREFIICLCDWRWDNAFRLLDVRCTGRLTRDDFLHGLATLGYSGEAQDVFADIDTDRDGYISFEEFAKYFTVDSTPQPSPNSTVEIPAFQAHPCSPFSNTTEALSPTVDESSKLCRVLQDELQLVRTERQETQEALQQNIRSVMNECLRDEVTNTVAEVLAHFRPDKISPRNSQLLEIGEAVGDAADIKENLQGIRMQLLDFASNMSGLKDEIQQAKERITIIEANGKRVVRDVKSATVLAARAVDFVTQSRQHNIRIDAELHSLGQLLKAQQLDLEYIKSSLSQNDLDDLPELTSLEPVNDEIARYDENRLTLAESIAVDVVQPLVDNNVLVTPRPQRVRVHSSDSGGVPLMLAQRESEIDAEDQIKLASTATSLHSSTRDLPALSSCGHSAAHALSRFQNPPSGPAAMPRNVKPLRVVTASQNNAAVERTPSPTRKVLMTFGRPRLSSAPVITAHSPRVVPAEPNKGLNMPVITMPANQNAIISGTTRPSSPSRTIRSRSVEALRVGSSPSKLSMMRVASAERSMQKVRVTTAGSNGSARPRSSSTSRFVQCVSSPKHPVIQGTSQNMEAAKKHMQSVVSSLLDWDKTGGVQGTTQLAKHNSALSPRQIHEMIGSMSVPWPAAVHKHPPVKTPRMSSIVSVHRAESSPSVIPTTAEYLNVQESDSHFAAS